MYLLAHIYEYLQRYSIYTTNSPTISRRNVLRTSWQNGCHAVACFYSSNNKICSWQHFFVLQNSKVDGSADGKRQLSPMDTKNANDALQYSCK